MTFLVSHCLEGLFCESIQGAASSFFFQVIDPVAPFCRFGCRCRPETAILSFLGAFFLSKNQVFSKYLGSNAKSREWFPNPNPNHGLSAFTQPSMKVNYTNQHTSHQHPHPPPRLAIWDLLSVGRSTYINSVGRSPPLF